MSCTLGSRANASCNFILVSGVLRSWLTQESISVRWRIWRKILLRMRLNAWIAFRTSLAPRMSTLSVVSCPLPNLSATRSRWRRGLTWLRINSAAIENSSIEEPTIHITNIYVVELNNLSRGITVCNTPCASCSCTTTWLSKGLLSMTNGRLTFSSSIAPRCFVKKLELRALLASVSIICPRNRLTVNPRFLL